MYNYQNYYYMLAQQQKNYTGTMNLTNTGTGTGTGSGTGSNNYGNYQNLQQYCIYNITIFV